MTTQKPGCLAAILRIFRLGKRTDRKELPYRLRDDFLSNGEASFYHVLKTMVGDQLIVCPQVSLAALFFVPRGEAYQTYLNKIDRKRVDFLLCDSKTLKPVLAIELDDSSHEHPNRQERDAFVEQVFQTAQLPLVRVPAQRAYNTHELGVLFQAAMQKRQAEKSIEPHPASLQSEPPICPNCAVPMVLRTARRGISHGQQFYGCPNYPRCNAVIPLK